MTARRKTPTILRVSSCGHALLYGHHKPFRDQFLAELPAA